MLEAREKEVAALKKQLLEDARVSEVFCGGCGLVLVGGLLCAYTVCAWSEWVLGGGGGTPQSQGGCQGEHVVV